MGIAAHYLQCGIELAEFGDDLGTQNSLLLSPNIIREFLVPEYRRLIALYKSHGVLINFHSCGHIEPLLDLFMELGVDLLNPLQATANDLAAVRTKTQGRMALMGGISSAMLMKASIREVQEETIRTMELLGRNGGYICCADQYMPFPPENLEALYQTVERYGYYRTIFQ